MPPFTSLQRIITKSDKKTFKIATKYFRESDVLLFFATFTQRILEVLSECWG